METEHKVKIGGREFTLAYPLFAVLEIEKRLPEFDQSHPMNNMSDMGMLVKVLYILSESGEKLAGRGMDVTEEWMALRIPPTQRKILDIQLAIMETMADYMMMETDTDEKRGKEIDMVLEEIRKKKAPTD